MLEFAPGEAVSVTRRLYRSGESEYLLNNKICSLRDIQDLFSGTGLAGGHYAIIEQGRIGQILSSKPLDRRGLIEEAAGITKFKSRKRSAELKLESAKQNLTRLNDIRRRHPALQQLRNLVVHSSDDDSTIVYSKTAGTDTVIVVVNVDPHGTRETSVHLDMPALALGWNDQFLVHDEICGETWTWGEHNYVRLDPYVEPAHILTVRRPEQ